MTADTTWTDRSDAEGPRCGLRKPGGTTTCIEPHGHTGSHGDGSVIRWIYREERYA